MPENNESHILIEQQVPSESVESTTFAPTTSSFYSRWKLPINWSIGGFVLGSTIPLINFMVSTHKKENNNVSVTDLPLTLSLPTICTLFSLSVGLIMKHDNDVRERERTRTNNNRKNKEAPPTYQVQDALWGTLPPDINGFILGPQPLIVNETLVPIHQPAYAPPVYDENDEHENNLSIYNCVQ